MTKFERLNGKWKINNTDNEIFGGEDDFHKITNGEGYYPYGFNLTGYLSKKDALLISKAPEMLEMLEKILESELLGGSAIEPKLKQLIKEATEL
jgi:hypothetical protein